MKKFYFFLITIFTLSSAHAQVDKVFWFAPPFITYFHAAPGNRPLYLRLSAMDLDADVKIEWPAYASSLPVEFTIPAGSFRTVRLDSLFAWNGVTGNMSFNEIITFPFGQVTPYGMKISASADITAYYQNDNVNNRELYALKGNNALGTEFVVPFQNRFNNQYNAATQYDFGSHIDIVASEANTIVTVILPASRTVPRVNPPDAAAGTTRTSEAFTSISKDINGPIQYSPGDTFTIVLQTGQSYSIRNRHREYYRHLGGTIIRTNGKKIAVTITDDSVLGNCGCYDIIGDQLVPTNVIGTKYVIMSSKLLSCQVAGDPWLEGWCFVTPSKPNTRIRVNGVTWQPSTYVNANNPLGYFYDGPYGPGDCVPVRIPPGSTFIYLDAVDNTNPNSTDPADRKPICVLHVGGFGCEMGGAIVPPIENCTGSTEVSFFRSNRTNEGFFMNIMVRDGAQDAFQLINSCGAGTHINTFPAQWFEPVPGSGHFGGFEALSVGDISPHPFDDPAGFTIAAYNGLGVLEAFEIADIWSKHAAPKSVDSRFVITKTGGGTFDLFSFDYAGTISSTGADATVTGKFLVGGDSTRIISAPNDIFKTDTFDWKNLTQVIINYAGGGNNNPGMIDNIVFDGDIADPMTRGWWVLKDSLKRFGNQMPDLVGGVSLPNAGCGLDGDVSDFAEATYGYKNGIGVEVNNVTKLINTKDFFHMGIYTGGTSSTNMYGYFSSFNQVRGSAQTVETGTGQIRVCYKDTVTLHAKGGLEYEWFYDPLGTEDRSKWTKEFLKIGEDSNSVCNSYGFTIPPEDTAKVFNFRVNMKRSVCFGDTAPPVKIVMMAPIHVNLSFDRTQTCSGDTITISNKTTGADPTRFRWELKDNYFNPNWTNFTPTPPNKSPFIKSFFVPYDSSKNMNVTIRFFAQKEHCSKIYYQDMIIFPTVRARMLASDTIGCNPLTVAFTDTSLGKSITQRIWDFGDGAMAFNTKPVHSFYNPLTSKDTVFRSKLTIKNNTCTDDTTVNIHVYRQIESSFSIDTSDLCSPRTTITINNKARGGVIRWEFRYGNATSASSNITSPSFNWTFPSNNTASVRIDTIIQYVNYFYDINDPVNPLKSCADTTMMLVNVYPTVTALYTVDKVKACSPTIVTFTKPNNQNMPMSMFWDFGDGSTAVDTSTIIKHSYRNLGSIDSIYPSQLIVQSEYLCRDTFKIDITVAEEVRAFFTVDTLQGCAPLNVKLRNASREYTGNCNWHFSVENKDTSTTKDALFTHLFDNTTTSVLTDSVILTVKNDNADLGFCIDKMSAVFQIFPNVQSVFTPDKDITGCQPMTVNFKTYTSTAIADKFSWRFGDGASSTSNNEISHTYTNLTDKDTVFKMELIAYTPFGCTDTSRREFTVGALNTASFKIDVAEGCSPLSVQINNTSEKVSAIQSHYWNYDNGDFETKTDTNTFTYLFTNTGAIDSSYDVRLITERLVAGTFTCRDTQINTVTVFPEVHPSFTVTSDKGCEPLTVNFTNLTNVAGIKFNWDFGDGTSSQMRNESKQFVNNTPNDIVRTVKLWSETSHKCAADTSMDITIYGQFNADFKININNVCSGYPVSITNNSSGTQIETYYWDWNGDGLIDNDYPAASQLAVFDFTYPSNLFPTPQVSQLKLYVRSIHHECSDTATATVTIYPKVTAGFTPKSDVNKTGVLVPSDKGCSPFDVKFENTSKNGDSYNWYFPDNTTDAGFSPQRKITNPNDFDITQSVKLVVKSPYQCVDSITKNITIYHQPEVLFNTDTVVGCSPLKVTFSNNSITSGSTFYWDFNDGTKEETTNTLPLIHYFTTNLIQPGGDDQYKVWLTAVSNTGKCRDSASLNVFVHPRVIVSFDVDTIGCKPHKAQFTNQSEQTAVTYSWDFGDTYTSVSQHPFHLYPDQGFYPVSLTGRSIHGCTGTVTRNITVYDQPRAEFTVDKMLRIYPDATFTLTNNSTTGDWKYNWSMGDGMLYNVQNPPPHTYSWWSDASTNYKYIITLIVSNDLCADTAVQDIVLKPATPIALFDTLIAACPPVVVQFTNRSIYGTSFEWNFGDNTSSTEVNPSHLYDTAGIYMVTLHAYSEGGYGSTFRNIRIFDSPIASFKIEPLAPKLPDAIVTTQNLSKYASFFFWNFGDDSQWITEKDPIYEYNRLGTYWVTLRVETDSGCSDTMRYPEPIIVDGPGFIAFPNAFSPNINGPSGGKYKASDLTNDVFFPYHEGIVEYHLEIYSRWGELIFTSDDINIGWDGYLKGGLCKQDVYVYKCKGTFLNGDSFNKTGDITVLIKE